MCQRLLFKSLISIRLPLRNLIFLVRMMSNSWKDHFNIVTFSAMLVPTQLKYPGKLGWSLFGMIDVSRP